MNKGFLHMVPAKTREYSLPLLLGVVGAVFWANLWPGSYQAFVYSEVLPGIDFHFLINDVFMVFFFGIAAVEITRSLLPGGMLNPPKTAVAPLLATAGGILGPVAVFCVLNALMGAPELSQGWAVPTATDIALAWLVARVVFGAKHPAVSFLLLLAVADDAVGLFIIAVFYSDADNAMDLLWLLLVLAGMALAFALRRFKIRAHWRSLLVYWMGILLSGMLAWSGMLMAHLHPALALVFIIPFLSHRPLRIEEKADALDHILPDALLDKGVYTPLDRFEHRVKPFVDYGLAAFGFANAGVVFSGITNLTWMVLLALLVGKTAGVFLMGSVSRLLGFPLPVGMRGKELFVTGIVAAMGLTVALFVAGVAFEDAAVQGAAKMGALFSAGSAVMAVAAGRLLRIQRVTTVRTDDEE